MFQARVSARHEEQDDTVGISQARSRVRHSLAVHNPSTLHGGLDREDMEEEGSYLEPIRLQGPSHIWPSTSRPLSASSLISSGSSPLSPPANLSSVYVNNDTMTVIEEAISLETIVTQTVLPPPVAYANLDNDSKSDDFISNDAENQHHLYINVGPESVEVVNLLFQSNEVSSRKIKFLLLYR